MMYLKIRLLFFSFLIFLGSEAQQNHFIYIQTENKQPFYVKLDKQLFSSAASGYIVLPKLKDGTYNLSIGFPKSEWPEQNMICTIQNKDMGFLLKNFGDKGWGLFNMQTMDIVMSGNKPKVEETAVQTKTDDFSVLLSNVVNDPSIKQIDPVKEPEKAPEKKEAASGVEPSPDNPILAVSATESSLDVPKSTISRSQINKSSKGTEMVFIDEVDGQKDTVVIFIPLDEKIVEPAQASVNGTQTSADIKDASDKSIQPNSVSSNEKSLENTIAPNESPAESAKKKMRRKERKSAENKFLELPNTTTDTNVAVKTDEQAATVKANPQTEENTTAEKKQETLPQASPMINSDCKNFATEEDFMKLRKKMVSEDNDDDMIAVAKKSFKTKCFTVDQVKNLSVLFLKDAGKYNFFDMAYPFVSDSHNFINLQSQLSDSYYVSRFQVMIRH